MQGRTKSRAKERQTAITAFARDLQRNLQSLFNDVTETVYERITGAQERGLITKTLHFNCVSNTLENADITPILKALITESSLPLR